MSIKNLLCGSVLAIFAAMPLPSDGAQSSIYTGSDGKIRSNDLGTNQFESDPRVIDFALAGRCDKTAGVVGRACENVAISRGIYPYPL